jgi:hypothetical protein
MARNSFQDSTMNLSPSMDQEGSPDSISLAFPPLPLSLQPQNSSSMPSPAPGQPHLQPNVFYSANVEGYDPSMPSGIGHSYSDPTMTYGSSGQEYENLSSFFEYPFLPSQRISTFSSVERTKTGEA